MLHALKKRIHETFFSTGTQGITAAAIILGATFLISRLLGLLRSRLLVSAFGVGPTLDAYFAAFQVPDFAYNLLVSATLGVSFIPVFCDYLAKDARQAWHIANSILNLMIVVMGGLCAIMFVFAPVFVHWISPGFSGQTYDLTVALTRMLVVSPWLFAMSAIFSSILNSFRSFILVALAPLIYNLTIILGIVFLAPRWGIYGVVASVLVGAGLHILIQIPGARRFGFRWQPRIDAAHKGVRDILKLIVPRILALDVSQVSGLLGTIIASTLIAGSVALFNLIYSLEAVPVAIFAVSFVVSVFPNLSRAVAQGDHARFRDDFSYTARQILFFLIPVTVLTVVFRTQIVGILIGMRGINAADVELGAATLAIFAASFIFQGLVPLFARAFFAFKNTATPLIMSFIALAVDVGATYSFLHLLRFWPAFSSGIAFLFHMNRGVNMDVLALALGFSVTSLCNALALLWELRRSIGRINGTAIGIACAKDIIASVAAGGVGAFTLGWMSGFVDQVRLSGLMAEFFVGGCAAMGVFILVSYALRSEELIAFMASLGRKIRAPIPEEADLP